MLDLADGLLKTDVELRFSGPGPGLSSDEILRDVVLELLDVDVAGHEIETVEVGLPDEFDHWATLGAVADRTIERFALRHVKFGLKPMQSCEGGLRIQI